MTVNGGQTIGLSGPDMDQDQELKPFTWVDDGTNGSGGQTVTGTKEMFEQVKLNGEIYGPRTVNPLDSTAPDGSSDKGATGIDPNRDIKLTSEPEAKNSAIGNYLASLDNKSTLEDKQSWIGKGKTAHKEEKAVDMNDGWTALVDEQKGTTTFYNEKGDFVAKVNEKTGDIDYSDGSFYSGATGDLVVAPGSKLFKYSDPEASSNGGNHSLPDIDSMLSGGKSTPGSDAMGLGQFKSGSVYDFKAMESGLEKLLGIGTSNKGSSEQGGSTGFKTNTVSDGSSGGGSNDIKGAAPSGGGSVAPPTGLEALMQKFGMGEFGAHLKDGSFDLDNFSAGAPSTKGPILDLDGNGQQDIIEWALSQLVTEKAEVAIVEEFHSNPALAEFHQMMMDKYADVFIA